MHKKVVPMIHVPDVRRTVDWYRDITQDVDGFHDRIRDRAEIVEGPHNMFYGMREIIVRDLNGFWITFGEEVPSDVLTPWPPVDPALLQPYAGRYRGDTGSGVVITIQDGRLLAFPDDGPGVFLRPAGDDTFTPMMTEPARVVFERGTALMSALIFEQGGQTLRFVRVP